MHEGALLLIGFSIVAGPVLLIAYLRSAAFVKTPLSVLAGALFVLVLTFLQVEHLFFFTQGEDAFSKTSYVAAVFVAPALFFLSGRAVVMPAAPFSPLLLLSLAPCLLPLVLPLEIALPILLAVGAGYSVWLGRLAFSLRSIRKQYRFELMFSLLVSVTAALVLVVGAALPWMESGVFYLVYSQGIGIAYVFVLFALVAIPDFVDDLFEATRVKYAASTLSGVEINTQVEALSRLMADQKLYADEALNLAGLGEALNLTSHQMSELLNKHVGLSFSQYLRRERVEAAKLIMRDAPQQSLLSVGMEVGFRSQSTFYAAFKAEVGTSPGEYRKTL